MEEWAMLRENSTTITVDDDNPHYTPVGRLSSIQPAFRQQSSGKDYDGNASAYYNELTLDDWLTTNAFSSFKQPLMDILSISKLEQILTYTKEDIDDFLSEIGKRNDLKASISPSVRAQFKTAFLDLIVDYTSYRKRGKSEAFRAIDTFVISAKDKQVYSQFKIVKEQMSKYITTGNDLTKFTKDNYLSDKIGLTKEFSPKLLQMSQMIQSKFETLMEEFDSVEKECLTFWQENSNPFDSIDNAEEGEKLLKQMESKINDFRNLDQFVTEFERKLNKVLDECRKELKTLFGPTFHNLTKSNDSFSDIFDQDEKKEEEKTNDLKLTKNDIVSKSQVSFCFVLFFVCLA